MNRNADIFLCLTGNQTIGELANGNYKGIHENFHLHHQKTGAQMKITGVFLMFLAATAKFWLYDFGGTFWLCYFWY